MNAGASATIRDMKRILLLLAILALLFAFGCEKPLDQTVDDLGNADAMVRQTAIDRLGKEEKFKLVKALEKIKKGLNIYNLGTGKGISVLEMVKTFEEVNKCKIPYKIMERRNGDIGEIFADVSKANDELGWKANKTLKDICKDGYNFIKLI